jgi:hypothetical protein
LGLFFLRLAQLDKELCIRFGQRYTRTDPFQSARRSFDRARYLADELSGSDELGAAGKAFLKWLSEIITDLDSNPWPVGTCTHLLLDRYSRECGELDDVVTRALATKDRDTVLEVAEMLHREVIAAEQVLRLTGDPNGISRLTEVASLNDRPAVATIRSTVGELLASAVIRTGQNKRIMLGNMVRDIVEQSSERLNVLLSRRRSVT